MSFVRKLWKAGASDAIVSQTTGKKVVKVLWTWLKVSSTQLIPSKRTSSSLYDTAPSVEEKISHHRQKEMYGAGEVELCLEAQKRKIELYTKLALTICQSVLLRTNKRLRVSRCCFEGVQGSFTFLSRRR